MKDKITGILSTRLLDKALIEKAACQNIIIDAFSFIEIKKLISSEVSKQITSLSSQPVTVVFTSINAVEAVVGALSANAIISNWKIYCIGGATFTLVKKYWPDQRVAFTANNASQLAQKIISENIGQIVFFCGNQRREELPVLLKEKNIGVNELVVYETIETPIKIKKTYNAILFFSPSAVNSFFSANRISPDTALFAIGNTTANAIKEFTDNNIIVSKFPAKDQLVYKALEYFSGETNIKSEM